MVSLPPVTQSNIVDHEPNILSASNIILDFERNAKTSKDALHARILGYLILYAPSIDALYEMVRVVDLCSQTHDTLPGLGQYFLDHFIHPCELSTVLSSETSRSATSSQEIQRTHA